MTAAHRSERSSQGDCSLPIRQLSCPIGPSLAIIDSPNGLLNRGFEELNYAPHFVLGLPTQFVSAFDEAYYNGRAKDVHGKPIGTEYYEGQFKRRAIDPREPPRYETRAAMSSGASTNIS